ncbi:MAG: NifU family protein [Acidimicrobiales bacterium]
MTDRLTTDPSTAGAVNSPSGVDGAGPPVLRVTEAAVAKVLELRAGEHEHETLALWVEVSGTRGGAYTYDMYFQLASDARPGDWSEAMPGDAAGGLTMVVPAASTDRMRGSVLDLNQDLGQAGMTIQNPNRPPVPSAGSPQMGQRTGDLTGDVAQRVIQVLDDQINPSIAAHGGRADLVAVEDGAAYLRLSGGCAGCGLAAVTLSQGIEVALFEAVPEVTRVIDVTDHAAGTNPYYEPAKK